MTRIQNPTQFIHSNIKAIFFDLDGTLVHSAPDIWVALNKTLSAYHKPTVSLEQVCIWVGRGAPQLVSCALQLHPDLQTQHKAFLEQFMQFYAQDVSSNSTIYHGVIAFLDWCQSRGLELACITNKPYAPAIQLLNHLNLAQYFSVVVGGDSFEHKKPHPQPLLEVLKQLALQPQQVVMIGDSRNDVEAAHAAGMQCIALSYGYNHGEPIAQSQPDLILDSLLQII